MPIASAAAATVVLAALVYAAAQTAEHGWTDSVVWAPAIFGLALLIVFTLRESRSPEPMLPLTLFSDRRRVVSYVAISSGVVASFGLS